MVRVGVLLRGLRLLPRGAAGEDDAADRDQRGQGDPRLWDAEVAVQAGGMVLCFLLELLVRLYLTPPLLGLITAKTAMEKTVVGECRT